MSSHSRRTFLKGAVIGAGATLLDACAPTVAKQDPVVPSSATPSADALDFSKGTAAFGKPVTTLSACQFCNSNCGLRVSTVAGRVTAIEAIENDAVQRDNLCVKAEMMAELVYNPRRLRTPLIRESGKKGSPESKFRQASWDEALDVIAKKFIALRDVGEARAITNRTSGRMLRGADAIIARFFTVLGSPNNTDVGPVCNDAGGNALAWTFGMGNFTNGYGIDPATGKEDLGSSDYFLFLGTNQAETHPVTFAHLLRGRNETGAKLVVVDPRKTATAEFADQWLAPKPHTDLALALALLHVVITEGLVDKKFVARWVLGYDELAAHITKNGYSPEWASEMCDVPADDIRKIGREFATAKSAAIFCNAGISHQMSAFDTYRALAFLSAITGNIGIPGGGCNFMHNTWPGPLNLPKLDIDLPKKDAPLPVGPDVFAESILAKRPYQLKAVVTQGNPLSSSSNSKRVREAFEALEFYVYTGLFMEESALYADVILPATSGLETRGVYMRRDDRAIRWQEAAIEPVGESKTDVQMWLALAKAMARNETTQAALRWQSAFDDAWEDYAVLWDTFAKLTPGVAGMTSERMASRAEPLRYPCPSASHPGQGTLYLDHPGWYEAAQSLGGKPGQRFLTKSGKIEIYTPQLEKLLAVAGHNALPGYYTHPEVTGAQPTIDIKNDYVQNPIHPSTPTPKFELGVSGTNNPEFPLMGTSGRPSVVHFAGVTHHTPTGKRLNGIRFIQVHPKTAEAAGIVDGQDVIVESPRGSIRGTALFWEGIRPDTIFVPNGFGPSQVVGPETGAPLYEKPTNELLDDRFFDNLSGQQAYKCFACRITPAES